MFDCKKCGVSGGIYKLLKFTDRLYLLGGITVKKEESIKSIRQIEQEVVEESNEAKLLPSISMPAGYRVFNKINEYLKNRGITMKDIRHWKFGETRILSRYMGYVLIPIYDNGEIRGYIGRYGAKKIPDGKLRYSNSLHTDFSCLLFGYDDIVKGETDTVIITEGLFDAIAVTKKLNLFADNSVRAVCTFGKKISQTQIQKLINKEIRNVILLYDYDALKEIKHYSAVLDEYFNTKVAVALSKKDIDECSSEEVIEVFNNIMDVRDFALDIVGKIKR